MRNPVDPNRCPEDAQGVPLAPDVLQQNGEDRPMSAPSPHDSQHQQVPRPAGRCPFHAMLEGLDIWEGQELDFLTKPTK